MRGRLPRAGGAGRICRCRFPTSFNRRGYEQGRSIGAVRAVVGRACRRRLGETNGVPQLTERKWSGAESDAWAMTALAVKLCESQGAYRGPAGTTYVFMTFGEVTLSKGGG